MQVQDKFDRLAPSYSAHYERAYSILGFEKKRRMELVMESACAQEPASVLDAGCGPGIVLSALRERLPASGLFGVDLSEEMLRAANSNNAGLVSFAQSRVQELPFEEASFDLAYALGLVDYVQQPERLFMEVHRILKPNGRFVFSYPNGDSVSRMLRAFLKSIFGTVQADVSATPIHVHAVEKLIVDCGFEMLDRHFITFGNGIITFPWSVWLSSRLEKHLEEKPFIHRLAWSCVCILHRI